MRIASYDLFRGAQGKLSLLQEFVEQQGIDILCLQEANGWNDGQLTPLEKVAARRGLLRMRMATAILGLSWLPYRGCRS